MATSLQGDVPNVARAQAISAIQRAIGKIQDDRSWSFQNAESGWLPGKVLLNSGTFTVEPFSPIIVADVTATMAINSLVGRPLITELQYRDPNRFYYSIVASGGNGEVAYATTLTPGSGQTPGTYTVTVGDNGGSGSGAIATIVVGPDGTVTLAPVVTSPGSGYTNPFIIFAEGGTPATFSFFQFAQLTLDRPWMEPTSGPGQPYMIYQVLFAAPVRDFRGFQAVLNTTNATRLNFWSKSQLDLSLDDPQRLVFADPGYVVSYGTDTRPGSATLGFQLFELWPHELSIEPISYQYERRGPELINPTDRVVYPLTEELVMWRAKEELYDFAEATKSKDMARGQGANFQYLAQRAHAQYEEILSKVTAVDANLRTDLLTRTGQRVGVFGEPYSTRTGQLNVGGYDFNG